MVVISEIRCVASQWDTPRQTGSGKTYTMLGPEEAVNLTLDDGTSKWDTAKMKCTYFQNFKECSDM